MEQNEAKEKIAQLVEKYERVLKSGKIKSYTEEETKKGFILPLFKALGWDVDSKEEVSAEEHIKSSGMADYGFYINGRPKFYLEAKPLKADVYNEDYAKQAIRYSFNKVVNWAVLTNFAHLKIFNANAISKYLADKQYFEIPYSEYLNRFDQLWQLSRESFEKDLIDKKATEAGKLLQKVSVTDKLYQDLNQCRELLTKSLSTWNSDVPEDLLDEGVQKLLDRIIFIRVAEDRKVEPPTLKLLIREWHNRKDNERTIYQLMIDKFRELDKIYDSNLFGKHPFEDWEEHDETTEKVIDILYGKEGYYEYDFKYIPADVLGNIYENYLGYQLTKSAKGLSTSKDGKKRKEQGIYYTPTYIVDYIVTNALKPVLDKCDSVAELKQIKVLDPACGSGSFLLKAMEVINDKYKEFGYEGDEFTKAQILLENIYGVDLDDKAVEIAQLNLLINSLDSQMKLPNLAKNIKNGNSLISGTDKELEKAFDKNYRDKKPFNWEEEFPEVFNRKNPGFDVIIGNPPWGADIDNDVEYFAKRYPNSTKKHKDIYKIFIDLGVSLLRENGSLGFITPNTFLYQPRYEDIKVLIDNYHNEVVNLGENIFTNVQLPSSILIILKSPGQNTSVIDLTKEARSSLSMLLSVGKVLASGASKNVAIHNTLTLDDVLIFKDAGINYQAVNVGKGKKGESKLSKQLLYSGSPESDIDVEYWKGSNINRYSMDQSTNLYVKTDYKSFIKDNERVILNKDYFRIKPKILFRQTASSIIATVDERGVWFGRSVIACTIKDPEKVDILFALGVLNSRVLDYVYRLKVLETGKVFPQVKLKYLRDLPFVVGSEHQQKEIAHISRKMIKLHKDLQGQIESSNRWQSIKAEIEKIDHQIDQAVYKLYNLTPEDTKIMENES